MGWHGSDVWLKKATLQINLFGSSYPVFRSKYYLNRSLLALNSCVTVPVTSLCAHIPPKFDFSVIFQSFKNL